MSKDDEQHLVFPIQTITTMSPSASGEPSSNSKPEGEQGAEEKWQKAEPKMEDEEEGSITEAKSKAGAEVPVTQPEKGQPEPDKDGNKTTASKRKKTRIVKNHRNHRRKSDMAKHVRNVGGRACLRMDLHMRRTVEQLLRTPI